MYLKMTKYANPGTANKYKDRFLSKSLPMALTREKRRVLTDESTMDDKQALLST
jgi:hypothetical protein